MRGPGILIMAAGLVLGVVLAIFLTAPGEPRQKPPPLPGREPRQSVTPDFPDVGGRKTESRDHTPVVSDQKTEVKEQSAEGNTPANLKPVPKDAVPTAPPADGQKIVLVDGLTVHWTRGGKELSAWRKGNRAWSHEFPFAVADVVRGASANELRVGSVDALSCVLVDGVTGKVLDVSAAGQGADPRVAGLLVQVKTVHADGLAKMRVGDKQGALAACDKMGELAGKLAEAKRPNEAFHIWSAAKKLRRAVAPEQIGKEIPKEQQPGPEDLEF